MMHQPVESEKKVTGARLMDATNFDAMFQEGFELSKKSYELTCLMPYCNSVCIWIL